jgi:hypothetical protein
MFAKGPRALVEHGAGRPYPADRFAVDVLKGVHSNRAVIIAPRSARLLWMLQRLFPGVVESFNLRTVAWARANLEPSKAPTGR